MVDNHGAKDACKHRLHNYLRDLLPDQANNNPNNFTMHKVVVVVIVYHRKYLVNQLHADSILRSSSLWNEDIHLTKKVVVNHPWDATDDTPEINGLLPDIVLLTELKSIHCKMTALMADFDSDRAA